MLLRDGVEQRGQGAPSSTKTRTYPSGSASRSARSSGASAPDVAASVVREGLQDQDLDEGAGPAALLGGDRQPIEETVRRSAPATSAASREQDPGQGDVLVLADVGQVVVRGEVVLARPVEGLRQPALRHQQACPHRRHRPHVGGEVADVDALGLLEQRDGAGQVAFDLAQPGAGDPPAVRVLRQAEVLAQLLGRLRCSDAAPGRCARSATRLRPTSMSGVPRSTVSGSCAASASASSKVRRGIAETSLGDPEVGERDRATEHVGEVPGAA